MIIDINEAQVFSKIAQHVEEINSSDNAKSSDMTAHIFQIDPTVTLENGNHPVVATTLNEFGSWVLAQPIGDFENSYKNNEDFRSLFHLMQSDDDSKTPAPFFDFTPELFSMVEDIYREVDILENNSMIGVIYSNDSIKGNPLFVIRFDDNTNSTVVEVFDIKYSK